MIKVTHMGNDQGYTLQIMRFTGSLKRLNEDERSFLESHCIHTQSPALKHSAITMFIVLSHAQISCARLCYFQNRYPFRLYT